MGTHVAITVNGSNCHFELNVFKTVIAIGFPTSISKGWEFRRRDSDVDSSSDNSKSSSRGEPFLKKHRLVSSLISPGNDATSGTPRSQPEDKSDHNSGDQFKTGKANKMQIGSIKRRL
ncbi:hypothetical protein VitviT2T_003003 [Vitis vinifera]|uniref:Uncharacterized protein n=1 Tax=Vitis vinifera TaxID=29760 RepID=A0ABY9BKK1_VITVI|nr:hypothetical protein VitviT2T_003003 [Vitis vinifera]